jgi:mRNA interferase MazF
VVRRGEIWWGEHPDAGRRPNLILTRDPAIPVLGHLTAAPVSRTRRGIGTEVGLGPDEGLPAPSAVSLGNVVQVRRTHLTRPIGRLGPDRMHEVCRALARAVDCPG